MWLSDFRLVLSNRLVERGSIRLESGRIAEIAEHPVAGGVEGDGRLALPGFVDMHGDMIEKEIEPRPGVRMPTDLALRDLDRRLAGAGVTTAYASLSFLDVGAGFAAKKLRSYDHTSTLIRALYAARPDLRVDHRVHARFEVGFPRALEIIEALLAEGAVDLVSLMDHTPGQGQYRDIDRLIERTQEDQGLSRERAEEMVADRIAERMQSTAALEATLTRLCRRCAVHETPIASHDDDTEDKVAAMARRGVTISEFPVTLDAAKAARREGLWIAMGAPNALRGESYSGNLSARRAHAAGLLDMLASDYHPSALLPAVLVLAETDPMGLVGAAKLAAEAPAKALGLTDRGVIAVGAAADLVIAEEAGVGHVRATLRAGRMIYSDGSVRLREAA